MPRVLNVRSVHRTATFRDSSHNPSPSIHPRASMFTDLLWMKWSSPHRGRVTGAAIDLTVIRCTHNVGTIATPPRLRAHRGRASARSSVDAGRSVQLTGVVPSATSEDPL